MNSNTRALLMTAFVLCASLVLPAAHAADYTTTLAGFWTALVAGDTASLRTYYTDPVTLQAGCELLDGDWGIYLDSHQVIVTVYDTSSIDSVTVDTVTDTIVSYQSPVDMSVPLGTMLSAFDALVDSTTLTEWQTQFAGLTPAGFTLNISGLPTTVGVTVPLSAAGFSGDDVLEFEMTSTDGGLNWHVSSELTDY